MSLITDHINNHNNPHGVTKAQVGLGDVQNFPLASKAEVVDLSRNDRYIDAKRTDWVQEAFDQYLVTLGLVDSDGKLTAA